MDRDKLEEGFRLVLEGMGVDPAHPQMRDTARRTAEAWFDEICVGLREAPVEMDVFPIEEGYPAGMVALSGIPVKSLCAHHLLPFTGEAVVAYLPDGQLCGLSKLSRVVDHFARRPQMQEMLTQEIAAFLQEGLQPRGVGVLVRATHFCMNIRGVNHPGTMTTTALLGDFEQDPTVRHEFLAMAHGQEYPHPG